MRVRQPLLALLLLASLLGGCAGLDVQRHPSQALPASDSAFGRSIQAQAKPHEGKSGFRLLSNSSEAFMARAELIRNAQSSIDLQYYIVHDGLSTRALVHELLLAADRGVRVRILLDDTTSDGLDEVMATLAVHPNVHIRVFNPLHLGRSTGITRAMIPTYFTPIVGTFLGVLFNDENILMLSIVGMLIVIFGAWLTSRPEKAITQ